MQTIKRNQFSLRLLPWLAALVWLPQARAILPPERPPLPNYDKRPTAASTAKSEQNAAAKALQGSVPGAKVDFDAVTGAPAWVRNETGFLTGPGGKGGGISAASLAARPADDPHRVLKAFLTEHAKLFGHGAEALAAARVKREFPTAHNGLKTVVWEQQVDDIPLFQGLLIAHTTKQGELVSVSSGFLPDPVAAADRGTPKRVALQASPAVAAAQAVALAAQDIGEVLTREQVSAVEAEAQGPTRQQHFRAPGLNGETTAQLVWLPLSGASLRLCWDVMLTSRARGEMFRLLVDAETGEVLVRHCLTSYISDATYRVYTSDSPSPFSPGWSTPNSGQPPVISRTLLTLSALDTNASPNGWIDDGVSETIGNNVDAHTDRNNDNQPDLPRPQGGTGRVFDFPMDLSTQDPTSYSQAGGGAVVLLEQLDARPALPTGVHGSGRQFPEQQFWPWRPGQ